MTEEMDQAMQKLKDGVKAGKEALKNLRLPSNEMPKEEKKAGRPKGVKNKSKLGDRRPVK